MSLIYHVTKILFLPMICKLRVTRGIWYKIALHWGHAESCKTQKVDREILIRRLFTVQQRLNKIKVLYVHLITHTNTCTHTHTHTQTHTHTHTYTHTYIYYQQVGLKFEEETSEMLRLEHGSKRSIMVLKLGRSGQQIRNAWKVLKCGAGEGWRRSVGPIMWEMKKCYFDSMSRGISYMKLENGRLTRLVTSYVETAFYNKLLKDR